MSAQKEADQAAVTKEISGGWAAMEKAGGHSEGTAETAPVKWKYYQFQEDGTLTISSAEISDQDKEDGALHLNVSAKPTDTGTYTAAGTKVICTVNNEKTTYIYHAGNDSLEDQSHSDIVLSRDLDRMNFKAVSDEKDRHLVQSLKGSWICSWKVIAGENNKMKTSRADQSMLTFYKNMTCSLHEGNKKQNDGNYTIHGNVFYVKIHKRLMSGVIASGSDDSLTELNLGDRIASSRQYLEVTEQSGKVAIWKQK
ncbi:MAG: hypothetical protein ACOX8G_05175 [Eubacterium sp.]